MSRLTNSDIENILNETSKSMFNKSVELAFKITPSEQVQLLLSGSVAAKHPYLKNRIISKAKSNSIIGEIRRTSTTSAHINIILNILKNVTVGRFNWNQYIEFNLNIDNDIIEKAKEALKEHIDTVESFFIQPIEVAISNITTDINALNLLWKEYIINPNVVIDSIDSFKEYTTVKEEVVYPYLELVSKTGKVKLTEDSMEHFIKVENDNLEIEKLKETLRILDKYSEQIKKFIDINSIIDEVIKEREKIGFDIDESYYNKSNCISIYNKKINRAIDKDILAGELKINSITYNVCSNDVNIIKEALINLSNKISDDIKNQIEEEIRRCKERFNKHYTVEILSLINDFSKKGITTYVSILSGEKGTKITSNKYDTSESYGCMESYTKAYITNTLRDFIESGIIIEQTYKASFGRYTGLTLSNESKEFIKNCNTAILTTNTNSPEIEI
ncbi:MAG: hypothetical protein IJH34_10545, partial [Romboutsia sp.]|nr:hypothetical protein [Romboutsia sp.]